VILDDPHNVIKAESEEREKTVRFFRESMSNCLNDDRSAIIVIMQRLHEADVSGDILVRESDYWAPRKIDFRAKHGPFRSEGLIGTGTKPKSRSS
jgi:hypothetical protein